MFPVMCGVLTRMNSKENYIFCIKFSLNVLSVPAKQYFFYEYFTFIVLSRKRLLSHSC